MKDDRLTIKHWAAEDRPREKLLLKGKAALSEAELIAILLGSGSKDQTAVELAQHILNGSDNNLHLLARLTVNDLKKFKGIGEAKAITVVSALELGRRRKEAEKTAEIKIKGADDIYDLMKGDLLDLPHEEFWLITLKRNNVVIRKDMMSKGGVSGATVDAKLIFKKALEETAGNIILVHNHPSGNRQPSREDSALTKKLKQAGELLDVTVLDHIIFTDRGFFSFSDNNMM